MSERYSLPTLSELTHLASPHVRAITVYASTSPDDRERSLLTVKSAIDGALRDLRAAGASFTIEQQLRERWAAIEKSDLWARLSNSVVVLLADDFDEVFVLPNRLEDDCQVSTYFALGQLLRAITTPQEAYALTLSQNGWSLWHATQTARASEVALMGEHPEDVADATNRDEVRDRDHRRRLVGDEGRKVLLDTYAARVAEAVRAELPATGDAPLFVFAASPLLELYADADQTGRLVVPMPGAADPLSAHQIDAAIREQLPAVNAARVNARVDEIADGMGNGTVATDLTDIARAAALGAVDTLVYDFTVGVPGRLDVMTGALRYDAEGYDLMSRIAMKVLETGGRVHAVRGGEVTSQGWRPPALAGLRFTLA